DAEQEYFSEGITEDIITNLSHNHAFFVISRSTSFTYKGPGVDVGKVGRELGVRYVLEGSVRRAGNRVRNTAQLIEAASGHHLWADRYDRELADVFAVQDEDRPQHHRRDRARNHRGRDPASAAQGSRSARCLRSHGAGALARAPLHASGSRRGAAPADGSD